MLSNQQFIDRRDSLYSKVDVDDDGPNNTDTIQRYCLPYHHQQREGITPALGAIGKSQVREIND